MNEHVIPAVTESAAMLGACRDWVHSAHLTAHGVSATADHAELFGELYQALHEELDTFMERFVPRCGPEIADPHQMGEARMAALAKLHPIAGMTTEQACFEILSMIQALKALLSNLDSTIEQTEGRDIGITSYLGNVCERLEPFAYKLHQRSFQMTA